MKKLSTALSTVKCKVEHVPLTKESLFHTQKLERTIVSVSDVRSSHEEYHSNWRHLLGLGQSFKQVSSLLSGHAKAILQTTKSLYGDFKEYSPSIVPLFKLWPFNPSDEHCWSHREYSSSFSIVLYFDTPIQFRMPILNVQIQCFIRRLLISWLLLNVFQAVVIRSRRRFETSTTRILLVRPRL
jgi:hypothetical protein